MNEQAERRLAECQKQVRWRIGQVAWDVLGPELRRAMVAVEVCRMIAACSDEYPMPAPLANALTTALMQMES